MNKVFILFLFFYFFPIQPIPINDTTVRRELILVTENTVDATVLKFPYIIMLYYDGRDEICRNFYFEYLKLLPLVKKIHPELRLGVYEMAPSLNTANYLRIHKHPHVKLFVHGIENEHFSHYYKPFENHLEIYQWTNAEIHRTSTRSSKKHQIHHDIKITHLSKNANFSMVFNSSTSKVIFCALEPYEAELEKIFHQEPYNITEIMQKLKQAFSRDNVKFYIGKTDFDICQNNSGNLLIYGSHHKHPPAILSPKRMSIREISKYIKVTIHHHILYSKDHDFLDKLWKTHKPLLLLFVNNVRNNQELIDNIDILVEDHLIVKELQFAIVDFQDSHGKTLYERFKLNLESIPSIIITHDLSQKSKKYIKKLEDNDINHFRSFIEKHLTNEIHEHRYYKSKRMIVKENHVFHDFSYFLHLDTENFNETINSEKSPMIVFFYYKNVDIQKIMNLYEHILKHMKVDYNFDFRLATFDLYHNEIDNIGYYNIDRMPAIFLYRNSETFLDLTNISHDHDIENILYVLEKHIDQKIKYPSVKKIKKSMKNKLDIESKNINSINLKNEL